MDCSEKFKHQGDPMSKTRGTLLGFGDFDEAHAVGAAPKVQTKASAPTKGVGPTHAFNKVSAKKGKSSGKPSPHAVAAVKSKHAGDTAIAAGKKAEASAKKYKPKDHAPLVPVAAKVTHVGLVSIGAAPKIASVLSPKQKKAVDKHVTAIAKAAQATKNLSLAAAKAEKAGKGALAASGDAARAALKAVGKGESKTRAKGKATHVGAAELEHAYNLLDSCGEDGIENLSDEEAVFVGECLGLDVPVPGAQGVPPDPNNPGYLADGSPDPSYVSDQGAAGGSPAAGGLDPSTGIVTDMDGSVLYDPANDQPVLPARGGVLSKDNAQFQWDHIPDDGIAYTGAIGSDEVGSWSLMYDKPFIPNQQGDGFLWHTAPGQTAAWFPLGAAATLFGKQASQAFQNFGPGMAGAPLGTNTPNTQVSKVSRANGCGPLVGDPGKRLAGVQYAEGDDKWFWLSDNAPIWATQDVDAKITAAAQAIIAANTATALATLAAHQKDAADIEEKQFKQQAEQALTQSAADAEQQVAQTKADSADITAQQSQAAQQAQQDIAYQAQQDTISTAQAQQQIVQAQLQAQADAEAQHELVSEAATYNAFLQAHPEAMAQVVAEQQAPQDSGEGDVFDDGGQEIPTDGEAPPMFEEKDLPTADDTDDVDPNWPHTDEEV
jgi:hypothetical protein